MGRLYDIWEVYGDLRESYGGLYIWVGKVLCATQGSYRAVFARFRALFSAYVGWAPLLGGFREIM